MTEIQESAETKPRDWKRIVTVGGLILLAALFSFLNADERIAINLGFTVLYRLSLVGVIFSVFLLGMLTMFLFSLRHDRAVRDALRTQVYRQGIPVRPLGTPLPLEPAQTTRPVPGEHELPLPTPSSAAPGYESGVNRPQSYLDHPPEPEPPA
jgi:hypothetical protein